MSKVNILIIISVVAILIIGYWAYERIQYKSCLETWTYEWNESFIAELQLTKNDFCKKGYTFSDTLYMIKGIVQEATASSENDEQELEKVKENIKAKVKEEVKFIIKPS